MNLQLFLTLLAFWATVLCLHAEKDDGPESLGKIRNPLEAFKCCFKKLTPCLSEANGVRKLMGKCYGQLISCAVGKAKSKLAWLRKLPLKYQMIIMKNSKCNKEKKDLLKCAEENQRSMEMIIVKECVSKAKICVENDDEGEDCQKVWNDCVNIQTCSSDKMMFKNKHLEQIINANKCSATDDGMADMEKCLMHVNEQLQKLDGQGKVLKITTRETKRSTLEQFKCCFKKLTPCLEEANGVRKLMGKCYRQLISCAVGKEGNKRAWMMKLPNEYRTIIMKNSICNKVTKDLSKCAEENQHSMEMVIVKECVSRGKICVGNDDDGEDCQKVWNDCVNIQTCSSDKMMFKNKHLEQLINADKCSPDAGGMIDMKECIAHVTEALKKLDEGE